MTAPMTAAEYREWSRSGLGVNEDRVLAALEEREALLGERAEWLTATEKAFNEATELRKRLALMEVNYSADTRDAEVGALVAKIQRHPKSVAPVVHDGCGLDVFTGALSADGFRSILSHLDSLLPKEPEVVTGPSGNRYKMEGTGLHATFVNDGYYVCPASRIPVEDAPVVAKLMGGNDGE